MFFVGGSCGSLCVYVCVSGGVLGERIHKYFGIWIQNTQEINRMPFNWMKQDETCTFSRKSSFSSYVQHKNRKAKSSTFFVSVRRSEAGGRKRAQD